MQATLPPKPLGSRSFAGKRKAPWRRTRFPFARRQKRSSPVRDLRDRWNEQSLARQFFFTGGVVAITAMITVGTIVTGLIEEAVTRNSAASTALYVDSVIAPLLPDMRSTEGLGEMESRALDETLGQGALGTRLMAFRLWRPDGTILYSKDKELIGKTLDTDETLRAAFAGRMAAQFDHPGESGGIGGGHGGLPLLKIYNPVLQPWSGEVVAVLEFHELATDFAHGLRRARIYSWISVATVTLGFFLTLSLVVYRGSVTIDRQRLALRRRVGELSRLLNQNKTLHERVQGASRRATALNETHLRRIGSDLHDGPAQLIALAALRLDSETVLREDLPADERMRETHAVKSYLDEAMREIRSICTGLVLPHIETADLSSILKRAVHSHENRTGTKVDLCMSGHAVALAPSEKICIYRFVQETLNNSYKHAGGLKQEVRQTLEGSSLKVEVGDAGRGFDPATVLPESLGLAGLRDRVESLGGTFQIASSSEGTCVKMVLSIQAMEPE